MIMKKKYLIFPLLLLLLLPTTAVFAQTVVTSGEEINNDVEVFEEDLIVDDGATINGDVAVFNGNAVISGTIDGDLAVFNGQATIIGTVDGDVAVFNGNIVVEDAADFSGDYFVINGELINNGSERLEGVALPGLVPDEWAEGFSANFSPDFEGPVITPPVPPTPPKAPTPPNINYRHDGPSFWGGVAGAGVSSIFMGLIAFVVAAAFPHHLQRVSATARKKSISGGIVGALTMFAVPVLLVFLTVLSALLTIVCIGLLGFPIVAVMAIGYAAAIIFGWIGVGNVFGEWLAGKLNLDNQNLKTTAVLGTITLTLTLGVLGAIPFVFGESLVSGIIVWVGLGAVMLTKFGRRAYPPHEETDFEINIPEPDDEKVTAVLDTLPDDPHTLKQS